jgi:hypothetical protein
MVIDSMNTKHYSWICFSKTIESNFILTFVVVNDNDEDCDDDVDVDEIVDCKSDIVDVVSRIDVVDTPLISRITVTSINSDGPTFGTTSIYF